jgi:hypothetical protein
MGERRTLALIECEQCSALLEIYPQSDPGKPTLDWMTRDQNLCRSTSVAKCPYAHAEVERRFPGFDA